MMTLIRKKYILLLIILVFFLNSCESLKRVAGLEKPVIDDSVIQETPDLILPPEFDLSPANENVNSYTQKNEETNDVFIDNEVNSQSFVLPDTKNFLAPNLTIPSAKSPSDSIEKFRKNRSFTVGEWVFKQSLNDYKYGNLYFRPIYDKGYNFSRRYTPVPSKHPSLENFSSKINQENIMSKVPIFDKDIEMSGEIPILE